MQYWYNIRKGCVETDEDRSQNDEVMGPYDTPEEAAAALATARANTERWDEEDREWDEWGSTSDAPRPEKGDGAAG